MGVTEDMANTLALEVLAAIEKSGDSALVDNIGKALGDSSQTLQEAFLTSVRVHRAERRARGILNEHLAKHGD